jgi:hypothetical protein
MRSSGTACQPAAWPRLRSAAVAQALLVARTVVIAGLRELVWATKIQVLDAP